MPHHAVLSTWMVLGYSVLRQYSDPRGSCGTWVLRIQAVIGCSGGARVLTSGTQCSGTQCSGSTRVLGSLARLAKKRHEKPLTAGPAASLPTFSSSGMALRSVAARLALRQHSRMRSTFLRPNALVPICSRTQTRRCACIRARLQSADTIAHRHDSGVCGLRLS